MRRRRDQNSIRKMMGGTTSNVKNRASHRLQAKGLVKPQPVGVPFPACRRREGSGAGVSGGLPPLREQLGSRPLARLPPLPKVLLPCLHKNAQGALVVGI